MAFMHTDWAGICVESRVDAHKHVLAYMCRVCVSCIHVVFNTLFASIQTQASGGALHRSDLLVDTQDMTELGQDLNLSKTHGMIRMDN